MPDPKFGQLLTGTPYVEFGSVADRCRLLRPTVDLPGLAWHQHWSRFELPTADGRRDQPEQESEVEFEGGVRLKVHLINGLPRARAPDIAEGGELPPISPEDAIERLVAFHIERCNELVFPSRLGSAQRPSRTQGLTRREWDDARCVYWHSDDEDGPLRLIVRIAEECVVLLQNVCNQPRRVLRRIRQLARFDRVQQLDDACVRWLVRQPGRTVLEKAGPWRRVLAVERVETADTLENRVVRDFLERIVRECVQYQREHRRRRTSPRFLAVQRLRLLAVRLLRETEIGAVPRVVGSPSANYVLQFDARYSPIWTWYERLRRQQTSADEAWIWRRRVLVEHARMAIAQTMSSERGAIPFANRLYLRAEHDRGFFLDPRSLLTPWRREDGRVVHLLATAEFQGANEGRIVPDWLCLTGADLVVVDVDRESMTLVYAQLATSMGQVKTITAAAEQIGGMLDAGRQIDPKASVLVIVGDAAAKYDEPRVLSRSTTGSGRRCGTIALPVPPTPKSADLRAVLTDVGVAL